MLTAHYPAVLNQESLPPAGHKKVLVYLVNLIHTNTCVLTTMVLSCDYYNRKRNFPTVLF